MRILVTAAGPQRWNDVWGSLFYEEKCVTLPKETRCPQCLKQTRWEGNPSRPFCSERCKLIDLGAWVSEDYRIAGEKKVGDDEEPDQ